MQKGETSNIENTGTVYHSEQQMRQLGVLPTLVNTYDPPVKISQNPVTTTPTRIQQLTEQGTQAKRELEILVATGKSKDLAGKTLTFNDLDKMLEQELLKFYKIYQSSVAARENDALSKIAIKTYARLSSWILPIKDEEKFFSDLRND
jgi:hypothetical protein